MFSPTADRPRRQKLRLPLVALAGCLAAVAVAVAAPTAVAAPGSGSVKLTLDGGGRAAKSLAGQGVKTSAVAPARKRGKRVTLPVRSVTVGKAATISLRGGIRFKAGKRVVKLKSVKLKLTAARATVRARSGRRSVAAFTARLAKGKAKLDRAATTAKLAGATLALTPRGAKLLRTKLAARDIAAGTLGRLAVDAGPGETGDPRSGPLGNEPPLLKRPASAVDVSEISIVWYPRDSWVRYLASGVGAKDGTFATAGATKLPPAEAASHPCSDASYSGSGTFDFGYRFAAKSGWYDPATGAAALYGKGTVRFVWKGHAIDLAATDPEIELGGAQSRAIFSFAGKGGTAFAEQRADLVDLETTGQPVVSGRTRTYTAVRGRLTDNGQAVFAGFYPPPNNGFGCFNVAFTTP